MCARAPRESWRRRDCSREESRQWPRVALSELSLMALERSARRSPRGRVAARRVATGRHGRDGSNLSTERSTVKSCPPDCRARRIRSRELLPPTLWRAAGRKNVAYGGAATTSVIVTIRRSKSPRYRQAARRWASAHWDSDDSQRGVRSRPAECRVQCGPKRCFRRSDRRHNVCPVNVTRRSVAFRFDAL
jgi:hypothetical protein